MNKNRANKKDNKNKNFTHFVGTSKAMQNVYEKIMKLALTNIPICIEGESGTGKEICAQMLYYYSDRKDKPFIALNCAALPKDLIESSLFGHVQGAFTGAVRTRDGAIFKAKGGTLFLDEIGDLSLDLQVKLLRFCQEFTYSKLGSDILLQADIRLICATNKDLKQLVHFKKFREDLYYRLYIASILMPPLRDREGDILDIAYYYLKHYSAEQGKGIKSFSENAEIILSQYSWPGNVRELQNIVQQIVSLENAPLILASMLPDAILRNTPSNTKSFIKNTPQVSMPLWKIEQRAIQETIAFAGGNTPKAAAMLDIAPSTIYRKMKLWKDK